MSAVKVPDHVIDLKDYIDISKYRMIDYGAHARMTGKYRDNSLSNITIVDDPGLYIVIVIVIVKTICNAHKVNA